MRAQVLLAVLLGQAFSASAIADVVVLETGGRLKGTIVDESSSTVTIDVGPGRVAVPRSRIREVVRGSSHLATYRDRASRLAPDDLDGWLALGIWARERQLATQARDAFEHVVALDPTNAMAQRALGRVEHDGQWMTDEQAQRARGYIEVDGSWVSPEERRAQLEERRLEIEAQRITAAAEIAEARARAREAEALAREAEGAEEEVWWTVPSRSRYRGRRHPRHDREREKPCLYSTEEERDCPPPDRGATSHGPSGSSGAKSAGSGKSYPDPAERRAGRK